MQAEVAAEGRSLSLSLLLTRTHSLSHSFSNCGLGFSLSPFTFFDLERSLEKNEANFFPLFIFISSDKAKASRQDYALLKGTTNTKITTITKIITITTLPLPIFVQIIKGLWWR